MSLTRALPMAMRGHCRIPRFHRRGLALRKTQGCNARHDVLIETDAVIQQCILPRIAIIAAAANSMRTSSMEVAMAVFQSEDLDNTAWTKVKAKFGRLTFAGERSSLVDSTRRISSAQSTLQSRVLMAEEAN